MLPKLDEIKARRKQLGLTQIELAAKCGVSQSLITKIEAGKLIPGYEKAKSILDILESMGRENELKAKDIMARNVISVSPNASLADAAKAMRNKAVSQLPVLEGGAVLGTVSEKVMIEKLQKMDDIKDAANVKVRDTMDSAMPVINEDAAIGLVSAVLEHSPGAVVSEKGRIKGIITKSDLLALMLKKRV